MLEGNFLVEDSTISLEANGFGNAAPPEADAFFNSLAIRSAPPTKPGPPAKGDPGQEPTGLTQIVKGKAAEINNALIKGDYGKVADLTHPKVIEMAGGRQKMIAAMEAGTKEMKAKGLEISSCQIGVPSDPVKSESDLFVVVPFELEMKVPGGKARQGSFVIGVSGDMGKSWVFVNGDVDVNQLKQVLPTLPNGLKLPEKQKLVIEKG